jgi:O-antigen/teichoic acid export membrane protein
LSKIVTSPSVAEQSVGRFRRLLAGLGGEFLFFAVATVAFQLSRLGVNVLVARWVGPEEFGLWNALNLILLFGVVISLGVPNGMNRDVPIYLGRRDHTGAAFLVENSFWFVLLSAMAGGLLLTLVSFTPLIDGRLQPLLRWMGLLFASWMVYLFFQLRLKSLIRFHLMSVQQVVFAVLLPLLALPLAYYWGVPGFVVGQAVTAVILCLFIASVTSFRPAFVLDWAVIKPLVRAGFPIMMAGLLYSLLTTTDRWMILRFLGVEQLGHYTLAILCVSVLSLFPATISQQMYPRMAFRYGETRSVAALRGLVIKQTVLATAVTLPVILITYILLPYLVPYLLPAYIPGITSAQMLLVGIAFIPLTGGVANFLNTINKQLYYLAVQSGAVVLNFTLTFVLVGAGRGLEGVALGATVSYIVYAAVLVALGGWLLRIR